jgi:hypothetical protein
LGTRKKCNFETGSPAFLIKLFKKKNYFIPDLEKVEVTESLPGSRAGSI